MPRLVEYDEELEFRVYHKETPKEHRVLLPSELDLAIKRMMLAEQEAELERLAEQPEPPNIKRCRAILTEPEHAEFEDARSKVAAYEARRGAETDAWNTAFYRTERQLQKMEEKAENPNSLGGEAEHIRFRMREFSQRERLEADEEFATLEEQNGQRVKTIEIAARNLKLLQQALIGEWVPDGALPDGANVSSPVKAKEFGGERYLLVMIEDQEVEHFQQTIVQTLIDRMWAKNTMAPELAGFFEKRQKPSA
jgi:hypothetical protein